MIVQYRTRLTDAARNFHITGVTLGWLLFFCIKTAPQIDFGMLLCKYQDLRLSSSGFTESRMWRMAGSKAA